MVVEAEYITGLEERLGRNYRELKDPQIAKETVDFLRQNPDPNQNPYVGFITTLTLKQLTKVFFHSFENLTDEERESLSITLDDEIFKIALAYSREGIRRLESGETRDEPFPSSPRSLDVMLGHWYNHTGNLQFELAGLDGRTEEFLEAAYESFSRSTALCGIVEPSSSAVIYRRKSQTAVKLAEVSDRKEHWLVKALHDIEQCITGLPEEEIKHAVCSIADKASIALKLAECDHDTEKWIDLAYDEYKNAAIGFEDIDPSCVGYVIANMAKVLTKKAEHYTGKKRRKLLERVYHHQIEASRSSWDHDANHTCYQLSFAANTAQEIATLYNNPDKKKEVLIRSSDVGAEAGRYAEILRQIALNPVCAAAEEYPSFVEAVDKVDDRKLLLHAAYQLSYAGDNRFLAAELEDDLGCKERLIEEAIEMAKEGADLIRKVNDRHWAMTYSNMAKFAQLAYNISGDQRYSDQAMGFAKAASNYFLKHPSKENDDSNRAMAHIINKLHRRKNKRRGGHPHRKSKSQRKERFRRGR